MHVLVIEDDPKIAGFVATNLRQEGHAVTLAEDGEAAMRAMSGPALTQFDALVLDLMLPKIDGASVLAALRARGSDLPVLILSALDSVDDRVRGFRNGADDYLVKPFAFDELLARLFALVRRATASASRSTVPTRLTLADLQLDRLSRRAWRGATLIGLQPREFALLEYFLGNVDRALTKAMILEHVWGWTFDPRTNVVDVLVFRLRNKIDREHAQKLIHTIRGIGYVCRVG